MERQINFSKSEPENKYILKQKNKEEKMEIDSNDLNLNGKVFYDTFFANNKFNKGDIFNFTCEIENPSSIDIHIFEKVKELFMYIQKELNK